MDVENLLSNEEVYKICMLVFMVYKMLDDRIKEDVMGSADRKAIS